MKLLLPFILVTFIKATLFAQAQPSFPGKETNLPASDRRLELVYQKLIAFPQGTQVSLALIKDGKVLFEGFERGRDTVIRVENSRKSFEIGSFSKVFTSTLLADMVLAGTVKLDDKLADLIQFSSEVSAQITLRQLANHTSGLPRLPANLNLLTVDPKDPYKNYGEKELMEYLSEEVKVISMPGTKYEYSNLGAGLLGYLLWKKEKSDYESMLKKYVFSRYRMSNTTSKRELLKTALVPGLDPSGMKSGNWNFGVLVGAGGIYSTAEDLSKFILAQFDDKNMELQLTHRPTFSVNSNLEIGLAWHLLKRKDGSQWLWHNGGTGGYSSSVSMDCIRRNAVIILSNVSGLHPGNGNIDQLGFELLSILK